MQNTKRYDVLALLSGGLDSILAARLMLDQGLKVLGLHFMSPFYGKPAEIQQWSKDLGMDVELVDHGQTMCDLLLAPANGFGSVMNPCVDCKISMMQKTREYMATTGAQCIVSGEVLGQRPMSQRRDTLNIISRDGGVRDVLLRPLCAKHMAPTPAEESGLVDRERLLGFSGRGRKDQLALAKAMNLPRIPAPAGGCMLTEKENARRYWPLLAKANDVFHPLASDYALANVGRQMWLQNYWLAIGRDQNDNESMEKCIRPDDILFKTAGFPGPLALGRKIGTPATWEKDALVRAAAMVASYSPKACRAHEAGESITVRVRQGTHQEEIIVSPSRDMGFLEPAWDDAHAFLQERKKQHNA